MSAAPLLSIGVPVYNGERYLADALESALRQDYPNLEVVIADNGSTDATPAICQRFATDARVRYARSSDTCEPIANFARALSMARGTYFTWLAHDDVLTSPAYASTLVARLEANRDAVLCASALELFTNEEPPERSTLSYAPFTTGGPWAAARRALFQWPPGDWETLIYGMFRRDCLERQVLENPSFRLPLQRLAFAGRFIIEPTALRAYRLHDDSLGRRRASKSAFALLLQGLSLKRQLLVAALGCPAPLSERISLGLVAFSNFFGDHLTWAYGVRRQIHTLEAELMLLATVADERAALIRRLDAELQTRGVAGPPAVADAAAVRPATRLRRRANPFRKPDAEDFNDLRELAGRVAEARRVCQSLLVEIEARHGALNPRVEAPAAGAPDASM